MLHDSAIHVDDLGSVTHAGMPIEGRLGTLSLLGEVLADAVHIDIGANLDSGKLLIVLLGIIVLGAVGAERNEWPESNVVTGSGHFAVLAELMEAVVNARPISVSCALGDKPETVIVLEEGVLDLDYHAGLHFDSVDILHAISFLSVS